jgi:NAD(P)-dependent dehydrogenase (short-subunit alcohol dehydrogenase family)
MARHLRTFTTSFTAKGAGAMDIDLSDKVALVTGGSRGLGREMVLAFAERGADVIIASRKLDNCENLAREVRQRFGRTALPLAANVGDWDQCDALADAAYAKFGAVDILVNNAGMSPLYPSVDQVTEALYDKVFHTNLKGPFRLSAIVGTRMAAGRGGSILNISSVVSIRPDATTLPYAAAKAGLNSLTEGMAQTFAPKVRVNAIMCGTFSTDISKAWSPEFIAEMTTLTALGRVGDPDEIIGAALYFVSDASSYTTGSILRVDGGMK